MDLVSWKPNKAEKVPPCEICGGGVLHLPGTPPSPAGSEHKLTGTGQQEAKARTSQGVLADSWGPSRENKDPKK